MRDQLFQRSGRAGRAASRRSTTIGIPRHLSPRTRSGGREWWARDDAGERASSGSTISWCTVHPGTFRLGDDDGGRLMQLDGLRRAARGRRSRPAPPCLAGRHALCGGTCRGVPLAARRRCEGAVVIRPQSPSENRAASDGGFYVCATVGPRVHVGARGRRPHGSPLRSHTRTPRARGGEKVVVLTDSGPSAIPASGAKRFRSIGVAQHRDGRRRNSSLAGDSFWRHIAQTTARVSCPRPGPTTGRLAR